MSAWDQTLASALVGTERRPPPADALAVVGLDDGTDDTAAHRSPEAALLTAAAALSTWRRAGFVPAGVDPDDVPPPIPDDGRRPPSTAAAQVLELLVHGDVWLPCGTAPLTWQWLGRAAQQGWAVPPRLLPRVLDMAVNAAGVVDLLGARARWLAAHDERWTKAFGVWSDDEDRFRTGTGVERVQALHALRGRDAATGREVLEEAWPQEKAPQRIEFVQALAIGLSMDDEPFLEAALDDRAASVRQAAAEVLRRLPDSRLAHRMAERTVPLLSVSGRLRRRIEATFPDELDDAARRDGIVDDDRSPGIGRAAWWLVQMVSATPLSVWEAEFRLTPAEAVQLASDEAEVIEGWRRAVSYQRDARWAAALFGATKQADVLLAVPGGEAVALVEPMLDRLTDAEVVRALAALDKPWPASFSNAVLRRCGRISAVAVEHAAPSLAVGLDPSVAPLVEQWSASLGGDDRTRRFVRGIHHALTLRDTIAKELS